MRFFPLARPLSLVITAILALNACGSRPKNEQDLKIYGGQEVPDGQWNATIALTKDGRIGCTGTIVHPRLVITAAHCLPRDNLSSSVELGIYLGIGSETAEVEPQYIVEKAMPSPRHGRSAKGWNDIAYLRLQEDMLIDKTDIIPILTDANEIEEVLRVDQDVLIVGFGYDENRVFGRKKATTAPITEVTETEVRIGGDGKDSCKGDSGGPALIQLANGEWRVFGVVSRGGQCGSGGVWGRMDANICWIQEDSGIDLNIPPEFCSDL